MGNKRTYRSVPEARFVKRAAETASGKNIDDAIKNVGRILKPADKFTSEDLKALIGCPQLYFQTEKKSSIFPAELILDEDDDEIARLIVHCDVYANDFNGAVFTSGAFTLTFCIDVSDPEDSIIPKVYQEDGSGLLNIGLGDNFSGKWSLRVNQLLAYGTDMADTFSGYDKQLLSNAISLRMVTGPDLNDDEIFYVNTNGSETTNDPIWLACISRFTIKMMYIDDGDTLQDRYSNSIIYSLSKFLSPSDVKTFFGNKSIIKDPTKPEDNNIDLYKHYLTISCKQADGDSTYKCYVLVQSSSNTNCAGAGTKLKDLLKASGSTPRYFESGCAASGSDSCILYWSGTILQIYVGTILCNITNIDVDDVETV